MGWAVPEDHAIWAAQLYTTVCTSSIYDCTRVFMKPSRSAQSRRVPAEGFLGVNSHDFVITPVVYYGTRVVFILPSTVMRRKVFKLPTEAFLNHQVRQP